MNDKEMKKAAKEFADRWKNKGDEKSDTQKFWIDLLTSVLGVNVVDAMSMIDFEFRVHGDDSTTYGDAYIKETKVLIEQKSLNKNLRKAIRQGDGSLLTPFQQAKRYIVNLPVDEHPRYVITSNFESFLIYDMNQPHSEPDEILLEELEKEAYRLQFIVKAKEEFLHREMEVSIKAGELVGLMYDALYKEYKEPDEKSLKSLNMLCVRLVFCMYAEDAGIFGKHNMFSEYMSQFQAKYWRKALHELFVVLNTPIHDRNKYIEDDLASFPYVNGGLFEEEEIEIPNFTDEIIDIILNKASKDFDWSEISPTIFGAVFESTLNQETRRKGGMHYTSIENIHKVIDPLFLNDLKEEFNVICEYKVEKTRNEKLKSFQDKLANLTFLDPAAGSGNFLTETYMCLRRLENDVLEMLNDGQIGMNFDGVNAIKVHINQFYGIEINDFACSVAKTALWIAESQMLKETEEILHMNLEFLPLKTNANIIEGNALTLNWESIVPSRRISYIISNPPFLGARVMNTTQKKELMDIFEGTKNAGNLDYVSCWYKKAVDFIQGTSIKVALVSTNSIVQGDSVATLWKPLFKLGINIDFAYRTFRWDSEAKIIAHVHCVIIGFSTMKKNSLKLIFDGDKVEKAKNINAYLIDADNVFVENRKKPICNVPEIGIGNKPIDDGNYLFSEEEMNDFIKVEPMSKGYFKKWYGSQEFIKQKPRYCLWLGDCSPSELRKMPHCLKRVERVKAFRQKSKSAGTIKLAEKPTRFHVENMPISFYIVIPETSSEKRRYIPIGFLSPEVLCSNAVRLMPNATLYHFGILTSNVHMAWMRVVGGRMKSDYRYSKDVVYNNFPWPNSTENQMVKIKATAQAILDARALYPNSSLADLYNEITMPSELRKAHQENDKAVMEAYGFDWRNMRESDCVAELMKMYQKLTEK